MQINLAGHHVDITPALRAYVTEKIDRLDRHFHHIISAQIILKLEKNRHLAEGSLTVGGSSDLFANTEDVDLYAAIDALADKLDRQVRRLKSKLTAHARGAPKASAS